MKHVGKMKNNAARVVVVYKTLPGDPNNCLVVGTNGLPDSHHDSLMSLIEGDAGQQANELAELLSVRRFPDGEVMLNYLHLRNHLKKVPTTMVLMTPNTQTSIPLDQLNQLIAEQKGIKVSDLAVKEKEVVDDVNTLVSTVEEVAPIDEVKATSTVATEVKQDPLSASDLRSMADKLFKEAQALRKRADEMEPPVKKATKAVKAEA